MGLETVGGLSPLASLQPLVRPTAAESGTSVGGGGFGTVLGQVLEGHRGANQAADIAVNQLVTGQAQDLHTVSAAVAQADLSFRLILELRNRFTEVFQEVTRMQV